MEFGLETSSVKELLNLHADILNELKKRNILRTKNNPVGDYGEWLVSTMLGHTLASNSNAGFDTIDKNGVTFQVKSRRVTQDNKSTQLGVIRGLNKQDFDYLIGVIFDEDYNVSYAAMIPHSEIANHATFREHQNGHIMHLRKSLLDENHVSDITSKLKT